MFRSCLKQVKTKPTTNTMNISKLSARQVTHLSLKSFSSMSNTCTPSLSSSIRTPVSSSFSARSFTSSAATHESFTLTVPDMGDSISEGTVVEIKAEVGSVINADDVIIVLETDKVSIDVPTPISGTVSAINVGMDDEVAVGAELLQIVPGEGQAVPPPSAPPATPAPAAESAPSSPAPSSSASSSPSPSSSHGRVPAIRFRHGVREEAPAAPASVLSTGDYQDGDELAAGMVSLPPAGQPFTPIPERYRVKPLDAYTIELIEMGGAEPY